MRKIVICVIMFCIVNLMGCTRDDSETENVSKDFNEKLYNITMKQDIFCIMMAYPGYIKDVKKTENGSAFIITKSGKQLLYDDKVKKSFNEKLNNPDLQDMMEQAYPLSDIKNLMDENYDPGRIRVYPLLKEVYGESKGQVQSNLANVKIGGKRYQFNKNNKASESLSSTMNEVLSLLKQKKDLYPFVFPLSGTFNYRVIAGTKLLSPHSFGITIDLARDKRDYWMWVSRKEGQKRLDSYPRELVKIFERNNFIWGGKWSHFDILHYEYRPEIILKAKLFSDTPDPNKEWYEGPQLEYTDVKDYIDIINKAFD